MRFADISDALWCVDKSRIALRFGYISGALWCVEKGRMMRDLLIYLVFFVVLGQVKLFSIC